MSSAGGVSIRLMFELTVCSHCSPKVSQVTALSTNSRHKNSNLKRTTQNDVETPTSSMSTWISVVISGHCTWLDFDGCRTKLSIREVKWWPLYTSIARKLNFCRENRGALSGKFKIRNSAFWCMIQRSFCRISFCSTPAEHVVHFNCLRLSVVSDTSMQFLPHWL